MLACRALLCCTAFAAAILPVSARADGVFTFAPVLTVDALDNTQGGLRRGERTLTNIDLTADWQGDKGWELWGYVLVDGHGGFSSRYSGDLQTVSNIDAIPATRLFEAWARYTSADGRLKTTFGVMNLNCIFDVQGVGAPFLNSSDGIGPDISQSGPSIFPVTGLGAVSEWRLTYHATIRAGLFDAVPGDPNHPEVFTDLDLHHRDGLEAIVEYEQHFDYGLIKLGHWDYTVAGPRWDGTGTGARQGVYGQLVWRFLDEDADASQGLQGWVRVGAASAATQKLGRYTGAGLNYTGLFDGHDNDQVGISVMQARLGAPYRLSIAARRSTETTTELTYKAVLTGHLTIQPDVQYIRNPGGDGRLKDALVIGTRLRLQ